MSSSSWAWVLLAGVAASMLWGLARATELFCLEIRDGRVAVRRGRLPQRLLDEIGDVVRGVPRATLRAVSSGGRPRLIARGDVDGVRAQRLRNLLGAWSIAQLRHAPRPRRR